MSQEKNDPHIPSSSNPDPSAPLEPPSYADSVGIPIEDGQQPLNAEYLEGLSHSNPLPPYQSKVPAGLYDRTQLYAVPVPPRYDDPLSQPAVIQGQPIQQDLYSQGTPLVGSTTFVTVTTTCQECAQRREAKRIRQLNRGSGAGGGVGYGGSTFCCYCPHTHTHGGGNDCDCGGGGGGGEGGLFAIICLLVCCLGMLVGLLCYACCAEEEEPEERCSTCGSII